MMRRVHHPYHNWEDYKAGMYTTSDRIEEHRALSKELLTDPTTLLAAMRDVVNSWPIATEHNLTALDTNRRAWLGAAACCYIHGAREHTIRDAWWSLTEQQQDAANAAADTAIAEWETKRLGSEALFPIRWAMNGNADA